MRFLAAVIALLLLCGPADAAFVQSKSADSSTTDPSIAATFSAAVGSGHAVCGAVGWSDSSGTITIAVTDDKSNSYPALDATRYPAASYAAETFCLANITNGPITITATPSSSSGFMTLTIGEWTAAASPLDGHTINLQISASTGTDAVTSGAITPGTSGDTIVGFTIGGVDTSNSAAAGTGFTGREIHTSSTGVPSSSEDLLQAVAASISATFTTPAADTYMTGVIALKAAAAAGGANLRGLMHVGR